MDTDVCYACGVSKTISRLYKAHVTPKSIGGKNTVLLCSECHNLAPNTSCEYIFHKWCKSQSWYGNRAQEFFKAILDFEVNKPDIELFINIMQDPKFSDWFENNVSLHGHSNRGPVITISTVIGSLKCYSKKSQS